MSVQAIRVRRDALSPDLRAKIALAHVGTIVNLTAYGAPADMKIVELSEEWVRFERV